MLRRLQPATALAFVFITASPLGHALGSASASARASAAAAAPVVSSSSFLQLLQVVLALAFVLALIFGAAWVMRRFSLVPGGLNNRLRVVSGVMVGPKERVVIVEMDDTWLVVGVTPQNVSLLHTRPRPEDAPVVQPMATPFAGKLAELMKKRRAP
ncbi:hypothetical protein JCM19000A_39580 [Silvimonas sp. JCM 19000]